MQFKKFISLMLATATIVAAHAQQAKQDASTGKWGIAKNGSWLVSPTYDEIGPKVEGEYWSAGMGETTGTQAVYPVKQNGLWGFVDEKGKVKIKPVYTSIGDVSIYAELSGLYDYKLHREAIPVEINGLWGFVAQNGKEIIKPQYEWVGEFEPITFHDSLGKTKYKGNVMVQKGNEFIIVNQKGKQDSKKVYTNAIVGPDFVIAKNPVGDWEAIQGSDVELADKNTYVNIFKKDEYVGVYDVATAKYYTSAGKNVKANGKYGRYSAGSFTVQPIYDEILDTSDPSIVMVKNDGKSRLIKVGTGEQVSPEFDALIPTEVKNTFVMTNNGLQGIYEMGKGEVIPPTYSEIKAMGDNFLVSNGTSWGVINGAGKEILPCEYKSIEPLGNNFLVNNGSGLGLVNRANKPVIPCEYESITQAGANYLVTKDGMSGMLSSVGATLISPDYTAILPTDVTGTYRVVNDATEGIYVVGKGMILEPVYTKIEPIGDDFLMVKEHDKYGVVTSTGDIILKPVYKLISQCNAKYQTYWVDTFDGATELYSLKERKAVATGIQDTDDPIRGYVQVKMNGKWGLMNSRGEIVMPCKYTNFKERAGYGGYFYFYGNGEMGLGEFVDGKARIVVPLGTFDSYLPYETDLVIGKKGNRIGAYCEKTGVIITPVPGDDYLTYGNNIYFSTNKSRKGTMYCYTKGGKYLSTFNYTGNDYALRAWFEKTANMR